MIRTGRLSNPLVLQTALMIDQHPPTWKPESSSTAKHGRSTPQGRIGQYNTCYAWESGPLPSARERGKLADMNAGAPPFRVSNSSDPSREHYFTGAKRAWCARVT